MTLDWPLVVLCVATLAAVVIVVRPFVVERSANKSRADALADVTKRLNAVEAHLASGRKFPGVLR